MNKVPNVWWDKRYKYHLVSIIQDKENSIELVVSKYYGKYKQYWHYQIEKLEYVLIDFTIGLYTYKRGDR